MKQYFLIIEHCNGEMMNEPFIVTNKEINEYINGEYLIYQIQVCNRLLNRLQ